MSFDFNISTEIKKFRASNNVSMPMLSKVSGISKENLYKWEKGTKPTDFNLVNKLKKILESDWKILQIEYLNDSRGSNSSFENVTNKENSSSESTTNDVKKTLTFDEKSDVNYREKYYELLENQNKIFLKAIVEKLDVIDTNLSLGLENQKVIATMQDAVNDELLNCSAKLTGKKNLPSIARSKGFSMLQLLNEKDKKDVLDTVGK